MQQSTTENRQQWMGILARALLAELEGAWDELSVKPEYSMLRQPETGLVMVQARAGGSGAPFNMGEMTLTRCAVSITMEGDAQAVVGHAYVAGRSHRHAELAAVFDGLLQHPSCAAHLTQTVIVPLASRQEAGRQAERERAAATKVDFFTMVRGED